MHPWHDKLGPGDPPDDLPDPGLGVDEERLDLVLSLKPKVVGFHFGYPQPGFVDAMKSAGIVAPMSRPHPSTGVGPWRLSLRSQMPFPCRLSPPAASEMAAGALVDQLAHAANLGMNRLAVR